MSKWREECGVFGIWNHPESSRITYLGLYAIQHRGQESAGIVSLDGDQHIHHKGLGLVGEVFSEADLERLKGRAAIGHVRYSTTGQNLLTNAQPLTAVLLNGPVAIAHNGNFTNNSELRTELKTSGAIFHGTNDTELVLHLLSRYPSSNLIESLQFAFSRLQGAWSLLVLSHKELAAARDPLGFRPLVIGRKQREDGGWSRVIASETCAFDLIGASFEREIDPGEIFWVDDSGEHSLRYAQS
ncbi:MAG: class II glutamine amidotransferase, partial [Bdellovibrionaceae bacterium]|nr:class II glutamine amidotransferase [Pseudobdellovibrionaceae bacterium]